MRPVLLGVRGLLSLIGLVLFVSGVMFWMDTALALIPLHMLLGTALVVLLWILVALALYCRANLGLTLLVLAWSFVVLLLGVTQARLLPGSMHWMVRTLHLLVGFAAVGLGHVLAKRVLARHTGGARRATAAGTGAE
jgi:hypothetical protein